MSYNYTNGTININPNYVTFNNRSEYYSNTINRGLSGQEGLGSHGHTSKINILSRNYISESLTTTSVSIPLTFITDRTYADFLNFGWGWSYYYSYSSFGTSYNYVYTQNNKIYNFSNGGKIELVYSSQTKGLDGTVGGNGAGGQTAGSPNGGQGSHGAVGRVGIGGSALTTSPEKRLYTY
jgi:hypothetical protein